MTLRAHGIGADRGRLVREAIALLMTDLEAGIDASVIARRLRAADQPGPADGDQAAVGDPVANGAPADGGVADGGRVYRGLAAGARFNGGPAGGVLTGGGPVAGVLASGASVTGPPEGLQ